MASPALLGFSIKTRPLIEGLGLIPGTLMRTSCLCLCEDSDEESLHSHTKDAAKALKLLLLIEESMLSLDALFMEAR